MRARSCLSRTCLLLFVVFPLAARVAWAQGGEPLGPEFRVNTYTTNDQQRPSVASDPSGNFVVVWDSPQDGSFTAVVAQRFDSSGAPVGAEFRVNTATLSAQYASAVAMDFAGNFVVVWTSLIQEGGTPGIFGQRYSSTGAPLGSEFHVNTYTAGIESFPSVASDPSGNFVVVWNGDHDGSSFGVFGQRYASSGIPLGPEFPINTYTTGFQTGPRVAVDPAGNFVVVWNSTHEAGTDLGVFGQRFASSGAPLGPEFRVNTYTTNNQRGASVGFDAMGNFVIAWQSTGQDGSAEGIFGQRYANSGVPLGGEFRVNTYTTSVQRYPSVTTDSSGNFVVVWSPYDGSLDGVFGQRYAASGAPLGTEFRANSYTTSSQGSPAVTAAGCGNFVVVWESDTQDGSGRGIFGQRFGRIVPVELMQVAVE